MNARFIESLVADNGAKLECIKNVLIQQITNECQSKLAEVEHDFIEASLLARGLRQGISEEVKKVAIKEIESLADKTEEDGAVLYFERATTSDVVLSENFMSSFPDLKAKYLKGDKKR